LFSIHLEPDETQISKVIRLTIVATGGEYIGCIINDTQMKTNIKKRIDEDDISNSMFFDDDTEFESFNHDNMFHANGPNFNSSSITIEESYDVNVEWDDDRSYTDEMAVKRSQINSYTYECPDPCDTECLKDDDLIFYDYIAEKRMSYPVVIAIKNGEEFDINYVYIGLMVMDETINSDEVVHEVLYIPDDKISEYMKEYIGSEYNEKDYDKGGLKDEFLDFISDREENRELREKICSRHLIEPGNIDGVREPEDDYIKIITSDGKLLYEK